VNSISSAVAASISSMFRPERQDPAWKRRSSSRTSSLRGLSRFWTECMRRRTREIDFISSVQVVSFLGPYPGLWQSRAEWHLKWHCEHVWLFA